MPPNGYRYTYADRQRILKHVWVYGRHLVEKTSEGVIVFRGTAYPVDDLVEFMEAQADSPLSSEEAKRQVAEFSGQRPDLQHAAIAEVLMFIITGILNLEFTDAAQRVKDREN